MAQAERGMQELLESVDTMIVIPNEKLLAVAQDAGFFESFRIADDVLRQGVQGISDIITIPGIINRDFADVKTTMAGMGYAVMGTAQRSGENRAISAAQAAMASPLLEDGAIDGARGILINISGSSSLKLSEVNAASTLIQSAAHEDANIIFGAVLDESMGDDVKITVIATGFRQESGRAQKSLLAERLPAQQSASHTAAPIPASPVVPRFASELEEDAVGFGQPAGVSGNGYGERSSNGLDREFFFDTEPGRSGAAVSRAEAASAATPEWPPLSDFFTDEPRSSGAGAFAHSSLDSARVSAVAERAWMDSGEDQGRDLDNLDIPAYLRRGGS
jgi:cell division protein FtsZ